MDIKKKNKKYFNIMDYVSKRSNKDENEKNIKGETDSELLTPNKIKGS